MKKQGSKYQIFVLALVLALIVCALPMSAAENLIGDMNGDGAVNSDDAIYLLRHTLDPEKYPLASDGVDSEAEKILESKHTLRFDENGEFKVIVFADLHLKASYQSDSVENGIKTLIDREDPDLVILTGDNVDDRNINSDEVFKATLEAAMDYVESKKIPWMHVYGNHDSEGSYTREQQQAVYESFEYCVSKTGDDLTGVGNYVLPVYASEGDEVKFAVWGLDSGDYMSEEDKAKFCPVATPYGGYEGTKYGYIHGDQIDWYVNTSKLLEEYNGGNPIPGLMAFHIPLQESYTAWINREGLEYTGEKRDPICASAYNSGLFNALVTRGDVKAVVNGHDHINDFMVNYGGIKLCYSPSFSTNTYQYEDMHGGRVFVINEEDPAKIETYVSYITERPDFSDVEELGSGCVYDFEGDVPEFALSGWPSDTSADACVNEIKADIIEGAGVNGSKALATKRTTYHESTKARNTEVRWDLTEPGLLGNNKYFKVWIDLETDDLELRKACFGLITKYADATPYATDNHDTPSVFYYKPDGSNSWQSLMTGSDGCIGAKDNCPVKGFKGWLAFPIEYMLSGGEKLDSQSIITGVYFYYSVADAANTNKYIYLDDISLVEKLDFSVVSDFDGTAPTFSLSGWAGDTSSATYTNEIKADIIDGVGVNGSKALATKRTVYHSEYLPRSVELRWNTTAPVTVGSSKYFKIWVDFGTNEVEFRKAIFGLMVGDATKPYTTDNHDTPSEFYYKPDGSDTWQTLYTGSDGCIGEADNCPVKGIKGWLAFPLEYMLGSGYAELTADSLVNGIYFFYSYTDSTYIDRYVYLDEISLVEDYK